MLRARSWSRVPALGVAALGIAAVAGAVTMPAKFPPLDGTLSVRVAADERAGVRWARADASWATRSALPPERLDCVVVVLVRFPDGERPREWRSGTPGTAAGWDGRAERVLEQYRDVLPPELVRQVSEQQVAFLAPAARTGEIDLGWSFADEDEAAAAADELAAFAAPVCAEAVHGLVELDH